jgi:CheY-like chemotaxis protein
MDGIEALHRIRDDKDNINHDTPVVVLTANAIVGVREKYMREGFIDYVSKPVEQKTLLNTLGTVLSDSLGG